MNLYCYCLNNPIMYADPSGRFTISSIIGWFIGGLFAFIGTLLKDFENCELFDGDVSKLEYGLSISYGIVSGVIGGLTSNALIQMTSSGILDVTKDLFLGEINSINDGVNTFLKSALISGISYGISSRISKGLGKIQYKNLRGVSSDNTRVNSIIKVLSKKYSVFSSMRIGRNFIDDFVNAFGKTASNLLVSNTSGGLIGLLMYPTAYVSR